MDGSKKRKSSHSIRGQSLAAKIQGSGGASGLALEIQPSQEGDNNETHHNESGLYGSRRLRVNPSSSRRTQSFQGRSHIHHSSAKSTVSYKSRFSRGSIRPLVPGHNSLAAVHIVCAISENLARETCVASMDAGSPVSVFVTKQGNGQTYAETVAYLEMLKPDEVLLNDGRRHSQLARKIMELYNVSSTSTDNPTNAHHQQRAKHGTMNASDSRYGELDGSTVVKFVSRACFDQTKGAELLMKIAREETYDPTMVEEYILLSSTHAVLQYVQQCLGSTFLKNSVHLSINSGGKNRMTIDRATMLQLELLVNAKTGKVKDSLIGAIDCTKTTVGSRLLRSNLMSPPARADTINTRLELVDLFLSNAEFFYAVLEHLGKLPDVDKMLSNIILIPRKGQRSRSNADGNFVNERTASKGISALVYIKSTLQALPSFALILQNHLQEITSTGSQPNDRTAREDVTVVTDRSSLLVGLGGGVNHVNLYRHHLLNAIIYAMTQPALTAVLSAISETFTETTTFTRNVNAMRHQECFALKCEEDGMMSVLRKAFLANVDDIYKKADEYAEIHGLSVSVRYSTSRGYYLAVPADIGTDLPIVFLQPAKSGRFINCTTEEINSLNTRAQDNVHDLLLMTHDRIQEIMSVAREHYDAIATLCDSVALLDMCHSFADNVLTKSNMQWCRPDVCERSAVAEDCNSATVQSDQEAGMMVIRKGRHPIDFSDNLTSGDGLAEYIPNDTFASDEKTFTVITGINGTMFLVPSGSGKSTYLKQVAIITILAHCGCYVTAETAKIPIRDRVCCRIGNTDDQEHNISTFLLEMKETAFICNNATDRSLVLVDELGRATSNEDGVAIAWSMSEYLLKKRTMTFFVTHYPQLSSLATIYPCVQNIHLGATVSREPHGDITYTHKAMPGACLVSTDYGVKLSAVCGWPIEVVEDASNMQSVVESLIPEESLCHQRTLQQLSDTRTKNYARLSTICSELEGLMVDEKIQSLESIRSDLVRLHEKYVSESRDELMKEMDHLLPDDLGEDMYEKVGTDVSITSLEGNNSPVNANQEFHRRVTTKDVTYTSDSDMSDNDSSEESNGSWDFSSGSSATNDLGDMGT